MLSSSIAMTRDGQYIFVTGNLAPNTPSVVKPRWNDALGSYKPRVRCYDINELSLKFERCFDNECIKMKILSEDYSKVSPEIETRGASSLMFRLSSCMPIVTLSFIHKWATITPYEHQDKEEIWIIDIHRVISTVLEQRKELILSKWSRETNGLLALVEEMKSTGSISNKDNSWNPSQANHRT